MTKLTIFAICAISIIIASFSIHPGLGVIVLAGVVLAFVVG